MEDVNSNDFALGKVVFKHKYDSFENLIKTEGVKNIFPFLNDEFGENDVDKIVKFFESLAGSYLINKLGCFAYGIKAIDTNS